MNTDYRKPLGDSGLDYFDAQAAVNSLGMAPMRGFPTPQRS